MTLASSVAQAEIPIKRSNALLGELWTTLKNTARWQISSSILHGFMGAVQSAYGYAQDLNRSLTDIRIVTGQNIDQMAKFAEYANKAAKNLSATTTDYTNASLIYYQQGLDDTEVQKRTDITIKMANAAGQSAEIVSDQLTAIWNNFDNGSQSLEYYADVITALGAATASSTDEIATGLEKFASVAETVGLSYEYATAALATVTAETRQSADVVGTAFKTLFARIQDLELGKTLDDGTTLGSYSQALSKVGINIKDTSGEMKNMDAILEEMATKWNTLGNAEKTALAQSVAGVRQYTQLIALMDNWDVMQSNLDVAKNSSGTLDEQQKIYSEGWEAARDRVKAALEGIYNTLIDDKAFIGMLNSLEKIISYFDNLIDTMGGLKGLLPTIGVLLTKMFGPQLSKSIQDAAYSLKMMTTSGKEAVAKEKQNTINEFATMMADDTASGVSGKTAKNVYTEELRLQSEMAEKAEKMSGIEKQRTQILMDQLKVYGEQAIEAGKIVEASEERRAAASTQLRVNATQAAQSKGKEADQSAITKSLADIRVTAESSAAVKKSFQDMQSGSIKTSEAIKQISKAITDVNNQDPDLLLEDDKAQLTKLLYQLQTMPEEAEETGAKIQAIMNRALDFSKDGGVELGLGDLEEINGYVNAVQDVQVANDGLNESNQRVKASQEGVRTSIEQSKGVQSTWSDEIIECANTAMSFASALQMLGGMYDTLSNPDVSGWDKFISVFSTLAMTIPMVINAWKGLQTIMNKDTIATGLNTLAKWLNALASKGQADAANKAEKEIKEQTAATNKDTVATAANSAVKKTVGKDGKTYYSQGGKRISKAAGEKLLKEGGEEVVEQGAKKGLKGTLTKAGGSLKNIGTALKGVGKAALNVGKSFGVTFAFVAAGAAMVAGAIKIWNKDADAAKEAAEAAKVASENAEKAREAYNNFKSSLDGYTSAREGLDSLTAGTAEFREGVLNANAEALKLIETVEGLQYTVDENGLINIDQASLEKAQNEKLDQMQKSQTASMIANQTAKDAELKAQQTEFNRKTAKSKGGLSKDDGTAVLGAAGAGAATGAIIGTIIPGIGNAVGAAVGGAIGLVGGAIAGLVGSVAANQDQTEYEQDANAALAKYYGENGDAAFTEEGMKKALEEAGLEVDQSYIDSLLENKDATKELITTMHANTEANKALNQQLVNEALANNTEVQNSDYKDQIVETVGADVDSLRKKKLKKLEEDGWGTDGIAQINGANKEAKKIFEEYAEAAGMDTDLVKLKTTTGNDKNRKFVYTDAEGNEQTVTLESMRNVVATDQAKESINRKATKAAAVYDKLDNEQDVNMATAMATGDFSNLTTGQLTALQNGEISFEEMGLTKEDLQDLGIINDSFLLGGGNSKMDERDQKELDAKIKAMQEKAKKEMENINLEGLDSSFIENMSLGTAKALQKQVEQINLGPMGEEAGKAYTEGLNKMVAGLDAEDQQAALSKLSEVDWSSWDAMEQADAIMKEFGVDIDTSSEEWKEFTNKMRIANGAIPDFSTIKQTLVDVSGILNKLDFGSIISDEDYQKLMDYNDEWSKFFILQADGTRKFIGDADAMAQATRDNIEEQRKALAERQAIQESFNDVKWGHTDENGQWQKADWANKEGTDTTTAQNLVNADGATEEVLKLLGYDDATLQAIVDKAKTGNEDAQKQLKELYTRIAEFKTEDIAAQEAELDEMMASTATNLGELQSMVEQGEISLEAYNKQFAALQQEAFNTATTLAELDAAADQFGTDTTDESYTQNLMRIAEGYDSCSEELKNYQAALSAYSKAAEDNNKVQLEALKIAEDSLRAQISLEEAAEKYGFEIEVLTAQSKRLAKAYGLTAQEAADLAVKNQRMNKGISSLVDNWSDWKKELTKTDKLTQDYAEAVVDCTAAIADLVGASSDLELPDEFFNSKNMALIERALQGDVAAINALGAAVAETTINALEFNAAFADLVDDTWLKDGLSVDITLDSSQFDADKAIVLAGIEDIKNGVLTSGGEMDAEWVAALNRMALATGMSVEEMNGLLGSMGVQAKVETTYVKQPMEVPTYVEHVVPQESVTVENGVDENGQTVYSTYTPVKKYSVPGEPMKVEGFAAVAQISTEDNPMTTDIETSTETADKPVATYSGQRGSVSQSALEGSKGGGSKEPKKVEATKKEDLVERYKETEDAIDDVRDAYEDAKKAADRMYGAGRIAAMAKANKELLKETELLKKKRKEAEAYLKLDKIALNKAASDVGVNLKYDENGNIINYTEELDKLATAHEQKAAELNAKPGGPSEEEIEKFEEEKQKIDDLTAAMEKYADTRELIEDIDNEIQDQFYEWQDNNFDMWSHSLEVSLDITGDAKELLDALLSRTEGDFYKQAEGLSIMYGQLALTNAEMGTYIGHLGLLGGLMATDSISPQDFIEGLNQIQEGAMNAAAALYELDQQMIEYYGNALSMAREEIDVYTDRMEHCTSVLEHYLSLLDLMGKQQDYKSHGVILAGRVETLANELDVIQEEADYMMQEAESKKRLLKTVGLIPGAADVLEQQYEDALAAASETQEEFLSKAEEYAQALNEQLENTINQYGQELEDALTGGKGFELLTTEMEHMVSLQEDYLTETNKIYETEKLMNKAQQDIDKSTNTVAKRKLKQFIEETNLLKQKTDLSQFELDIQQAKYELLLAEIALEEAQMSKSQVRLKRDAEGNFGYVYTAEAESVANAEQEYFDRQNELYNIALEGINTYAEKHIQTKQEMYDTLTSIDEKYRNGEYASWEAYQAARAEAIDYYSKRIQQISEIYNIALQQDTNATADAWGTNYADMIDSSNEWRTAVTSHASKVNSAFQTWGSTMEVLAQRAGVSMDQLASSVGKVTNESDALLQKLTAPGGVLDQIKVEMGLVSALTTLYASLRWAVMAAAAAYTALATALMFVAAASALASGVGAILDSDAVKGVADGVGNAISDAASKSSSGTKSSNSSDSSTKSSGYKVGDTIHIDKGDTVYTTSSGGGQTTAKYTDDYTILKDFGNGMYSYGIGGKETGKVKLYDTGGYTGEWGSYGKLAFLHEKELVLNADDTKNFLASMDLLDSIVSTIDLHAANQQLGGTLSSPGMSNIGGDTLEQTVTIEANFPNVSSRIEIEEAFSTLVNRASQYANRK